MHCPHELAAANMCDPHSEDVIHIELESKLFVRHHESTAVESGDAMRGRGEDTDVQVSTI